MVALAELHQQIRAAIEAGEIDRPRKLCRAILTVRPENLETLLLDAELSLEAGEHRAAIAGFQRVLEGDPEGYLACAGLGIAYEALRDPAAALHWYSRALDLEPLNPEIRRERDRLFEIAYPGIPLPDTLSDFATARSFLAAGFGGKALENYRAALEREPGRLEIKLSLAELLWILARTGEAEAVCQQILAVAPHAVKAHAVLACIAAESDDLERGRALLSRIHAQDPDGRIASHLITQTSLAPWATEPVDLDITPGTASENERPSEAPPWARWMRHALWQVLRLVLPPLDDEADKAATSKPTAVATAEPPRDTPPPALARPETPRPAPRLGSGPLGRRLRAAGVAGDTGGDATAPLDEVLVSDEIVRIELPPEPAPARPPMQGPSAAPVPSEQDRTETVPLRTPPDRGPRRDRRAGK